MNPFIKHDVNTLNDSAIIKLIFRYHETGYGVFWAVVESLTNEPTHHMTLEDLSLQVGVKLVSSDPDKITEICKKMLELGLLKEENGTVYSERVCKQCMQLDEFKELQRSKINARWEQYRRSVAESEKVFNCDDLLDQYHQICVSFPKVKVLTDLRRTHARTFMNAFTKEQIAEGFLKAQASDFLKGGHGWNGASFDWLINKTNFAKVLEGNYDNKVTTKQTVANSPDLFTKDENGGFGL